VLKHKKHSKSLLEVGHLVVKWQVEGRVGITKVLLKGWQSTNALQPFVDVIKLNGSWLDPYKTVKYLEQPEVSSSDGISWGIVG